MDDKQRQEREELLHTHQRRLHELELQAATFGVHTPPHIRTEIEDIRAEISQIEGELGQGVAATGVTIPLKPLRDRAGQPAAPDDHHSGLRGWLRWRTLPRYLKLALSLVTLLVVVVALEWWSIARQWRAIEGGSVYLGTPEQSCTPPVEPFEIQTTEVTNEAYLACVRAGRCQPPQSSWRIESGGWAYPAGAAQRPVDGLRWEDADAYCRFIDAQLPTEAQWVRAARSGSRQPYPWGDTFSIERANMFETNIGSTKEVTSFAGGKSDSGLYHMFGNVREWVADRSLDSCNANRGQEQHVARGGSFQDLAVTTTLWSRFQGDDQPYVGVRCVRRRNP